MANIMDPTLTADDGQDTAIAPTDPLASVEQQAEPVTEPTGIEPPANDDLDDDTFQALLSHVSANGGKEFNDAIAADREANGLLGDLGDAALSAGMGGAKSIYETYDFIFGEPAESDKTAGRRKVERAAAILDAQSGVNSVVGDLSQFAVGMIGAGKLGWGAKAIKSGANAVKAERVALATGTRMAKEIKRWGKTKDAIVAAGVGAVVFDPYEKRLGNLIQSMPGMEDSILAYTAADPNDSVAEGRFKAALESIGIDLAVAGAVSLSIKGWKLLRGGDEAGANAAFAEAAKLNPTVDNAAEEALAAATGNFGQRVDVMGGSGTATLGDQMAGVGALKRKPRDVGSTGGTVTGKMDLGGGNPDLQEGIPIDMPGTSGTALPGGPANDAPLTTSGSASGGLKEGVEQVASRGRGRPPKDLKMAQDGLPASMAGEARVVGAGVEPKVTWNPGPAPSYEAVVGWQGKTSGSVGATLGKETKVGTLAGDLSGGGSPLGDGVGAGSGRMAPSGVAPDLAGKGRPSGEAGGPPGGDAGSGGAPNRQASGERPEGRLGDEAGAGGGEATQPFGRAQSVKGAKADIQATKPKVRWSDKQVRDLVNAHLKDMDALYTWGTRDNAMAKAGHEFTPSHVDWSQMNGTDDLMSLIDNVMHAKADDYASVRGGYVMSDKSVEKLADDLARIYNVDPAQFLGGLSRAGKEAPLMAARVETGFAVGTKILSDAYELARRRMLGAPDATGPEVGLQIKRMFGIGGEAINHSFSIVSNSARTTRKGFKSFGWSRKTLDAVDQMDPEKLINALYKSGGDPRALAKIVNPTFIERLGQVVGHLMTNNLLWGLKTHVRNNVSNSVMLILRPTEKIVGGSIIRILNRSAHVGEMSTVTKQARKEYAATVASMQDAWDSAIEAFKRGDSKLIPHDPEGYNQVGMTGGQITNRPIKSFEDMLYWAQVATGGSTRIMGASDEFFKQARYKAVVTAKAAVEGEEAGLVGDQLKRFIARRVDESFDETGQALDEAAAMESRITTFTDPLEHKIATGIQAMVAGSNGWGRIIMPFTRTPFKAWGYGVRYTPGLQMLHKRFMRDLKGANGAEAQATAAGQMALGYTATAMIGYFASQGLITGRGPTNKDQKAWLMNQGWSPYSLRLIGEDGKQTFVPLNNFDQIGVALGLVADLVDMGLHPDRQDEAMDVMSAIVTANAQYLTEKSNLVGLSRFFEMLNDPGKKSPSWLGGIGESLIPFSSALRTYANDDPYMREARNIVDHALDRMPGVGKELAPKFDFFGEPRLVNKGMYSEGQWNIEDVEVERLIMETGHMFSEPSFDVEGEDMRDIRLADGRTAYEVYNEALQKAGLRKLVRDIVTTKGYDEKPDGENVNDRGSKLWLIATYTSKLRNAVKKQVIAQHPELRGLKAHRTLSQLEAVRAKKAGEDEHPNILQRALDVFSGNQ